MTRLQAWLLGITLVLGACGAVAACSTESEKPPIAAQGSPSTEELLAVDLGGDTTRKVINQNAFGLPAKNAPGADRLRFEVGDSFFTQNWVVAPASTTSRDGLGPTFNARACASCHVNDGKASPPTDPTKDNPGLLLRLSRAGTDEHNGPMPDPAYGGQLQDRSIAGVPSEGRIGLTYAEVPGRFGDGTEYSLAKPAYSILDGAFGSTEGLLIGPRIAPHIIGMGLLESIDGTDIRASADPDDDDKDGISGRVNEVWDGSDMAIGRFGWKANVATVRQQTAGAFHGDIGISSPVIAEQVCPTVQVACGAQPTGGTPEVDEKTFDEVVFYTRILAVPAARDRDDAEVVRGAKVFAKAGCASCHTPTQRTGASDIDALSDQKIHPFTDLLLHDMGDELADGRPDFDASGSEWRTPPLWGIGLVEKINGHTRFLHDGRARSLLEAVLWHGGEGEAARDAIIDASAEDRAALIRYLESL